MIYCKKISLVCEEKIRQFAIKDIESKIDISKPVLWQRKIKHSLPDDLLLEINQELSYYGIPEVDYAQSYLRPKKNFQGIHIDGDPNGIIKTAINIPLKGWANSYHIWYSGNFEISVVTHDNTNNYYEIHWNSEPVEKHREEISSATLLRVDQPHSALANDIEDRWIFTIRFKGNPAFEHILEKVLNHD